MMGALSARRASKEELAEMRKLLDEHEKAKK
jgi:DNA-binding FadR family transcriptional regulator